MARGKIHKKTRQKKKVHKKARRKNKSTNVRNISVFINCPYDPQYAPIFDGIVFATVCCGYIPRCALETNAVAEPRMRRIVQALKGSKYSIHDLCRCQGHGDRNLARFNMPLELGIAMAEKFDASKTENWHDWLVLVPNETRYAEFISDLAGYDPKQIEEKAEMVIAAVMSWLITREDAVDLTVNPKAVLDLLPKFMAARDELKSSWNGHEPWSDVVKIAVRVGQEGRLIPAMATR